MTRNETARLAGTTPVYLSRPVAGTRRSWRTYASAFRRPRRHPLRPAAHPRGGLVRLRSRGFQPSLFILAVTLPPEDFPRRLDRFPRKWDDGPTPAPAPGQPPGRERGPSRGPERPSTPAYCASARRRETRSCGPMLPRRRSSGPGRWRGLRGSGRGRGRGPCPACRACCPAGVLRRRARGRRSWSRAPGGPSMWSG